MSFLDFLYVAFKVIGQALVVIPELLEKYQDYKTKQEYQTKKAAADAAIKDYYIATYKKDFQAAAVDLHNLASGKPPVTPPKV